MEKRLERRTVPRHVSKSKSPCKLVRITEEGPWPATVRNISAAGIGMVADRPFKPGSLLTLELPVKNVKLAEPRMMRVTHVTTLAGKQSWYLGGIFASPLSREHLDALRMRSPALLPQSDRRTGVRHLTRLARPCQLLRATEIGSWLTSIRNVSADGIGLIARRPIKPGMVVTVELPTRRTNSRQLRVTHARQQSGNSWWVLGGVFSAELSDSELKSLM